MHLIKKGFILLITLIFMATLTVIVGAMIYMVTYQTRATGTQIQDANLEGLADAGIDLVHRAIRDDYLGSAPSPGSDVGVADLRGSDTSLSVNVGNPDNMRYVDTSDATIDNNSDQAIIRTFDSNYTNTRIISIELHVWAHRASGGTGSTIDIEYTTDGSNYNTVLTPNLTTLARDYSGSLPDSLSWATLMSPNFRIRIMRTAGNRSASIESVFLRVTYGIDTLKEQWATGTYAAFPVSLGPASIESVNIIDEASKVHLNYASQSLLNNLFANLKIANASTKATNIVNYRGTNLTNPFDSVEELQQVTGITAADYAAIKDYVTVYSFVNTNTYRLPGPRAPININTASNTVLKSIFDSLGLAAGDAQNLADNIITQRNVSPFQGFYSSASAAGDNTYFYNFVRNRLYLSTSGNPDERDKVLDTADASSLVPVSGSTGYNCPTTEVCYAGHSFMIDCLARCNNRNIRVKTLVGNDGSHTFDTYTTEPASSYSGWRKENFE